MTIVRWGMWIAFACCLAGVAMVGGRMALEHHQGMGGGGAVSNLWKPLGGAILLTNIVAILAAVATWG